MQSKLYEQHPYNFVRLILGKQYPDDTEVNNRYTRAQHLFDEWQEHSVLVTSQNPTLYPYRVDYAVKGKQHTMNGFFTLLKLDPEYQHVKAHEKTLAKPKADRLNLMRACNANLEPIELLYLDPSGTIQKKMESVLDEPFIRAKGYDGFTHSLWTLKDKQVITDVLKWFKDKVLFIADGHHRYQTSVNFAQEQREKTGVSDPCAPFNYIMVVLVNMFDGGLLILPTHRLIKMPGCNLRELVERLRDSFVVQEKKLTGKTHEYEQIGKRIMKEIETTTKHKFALYSKGAYYLLTLKDEKIMDTLASDHSKTWRTLDVSILHKAVLERFLGITERNIEDHVTYTRVDREAIQSVDEGKFDCSFLMNATKITELKAIAEAGEHMPQKSTYFLPKMLSGLVMYKM
jgi:uncharacterized protein (DUF1015 family)